MKVEEIKTLSDYQKTQICAELKAIIFKHNLNFADIAQCLAILANKLKEESK